ncbi:MAG: 2,3-bisphosphoglycerate-independent phosphoglycerate mutase [Acidobacteriota bacterium]
MAKKSRIEAAERQRGSTLWVLDGSGGRQRFLRGVLTHYLTERGFDFDDAYALARALRDHFAGRSEVEKSEIKDALVERVESTYGSAAVEQLRHRPAAAPRLTLVASGRRQPFSRGLLAQSMHGAGLDFDRAYHLVTQLEGELRRDSVQELNADELARRVSDLLEREESKAAARRFRSIRQLGRLPKPLIVYVGGASGTGKSTVALELAPLLEIYRVTATDTIRQVMRSLISPQILPAIHGSSFDAPWPRPDSGDGDDPSDPEQALISSFLEQATRVGVGVKAVVERAIAENSSALIEGVHLTPPIVPFHDLDGACYQVPLMLGISDTEGHRARFLTRTSRQATRYVDRFAAIRRLHDHILERAESEGIPFLDTSLDDAAPRALRFVITRLQEEWPSLAAPTPERRPPILLLALDGMPDGPARALGGRTPLAAADTPTLDRLAQEGLCGLADPVAPGTVPDTAAGTLALLGQSPKSVQRGPVEAVGAGLKLRDGDIALRANFALVHEGQILDRRAGRIREGAPELAAALDRMELKANGRRAVVRVAPGTEHRLAVVLRGHGLSSAIRGSDPGEGAVPGPPLAPEASDPTDAEAAATAELLAEFEAEAHRILSDHPVNRMRLEKGLPPANAVVSRGAGRHHRLPPLAAGGEALSLACIAGDRTVRGIAASLDATEIHEPVMTANLDTDLDRKFELAAEALREFDLVILHVKGADIAAHDRKPGAKAAFVERFDAALGRFLECRSEPLRILVGSDHATSSESGHHTADPVPVLMWGPGIEADDVDGFDESRAATGDLGRLPLQRLLPRALDLG